MAGWAPAIGVLGVSWLIAVMASGVAEIVIDRRASYGIALALWVVSIAGSGYLLGSVQWTEQQAKLARSQSTSPILR